MKNLEPGTLVKIKKSCLKWYSKHADECFNYPDGIKKQSNLLTKYIGEHTIPEQLEDYFTCRYSYTRNLDLYGAIIWHNETFDTYLIDCENELGRTIQFFETNDFKVIK